MDTTKPATAESRQDDPRKINRRVLFAAKYCAVYGAINEIMGCDMRRPWKWSDRALDIINEYYPIVCSQSGKATGEEFDLTGIASADDYAEAYLQAESFLGRLFLKDTPR